ncbi:A/G-specific adenine glycosylase [Oceanibium sediminis]|uniref:A/G-specific adenine glycosylase n=1 Tax=Oceanibium sediminis TaxID=2026339 RepID=UPI000DD37047|nr:A/G-specific adenine glycosylase [Oceanibium sediminis]
MPQTPSELLLSWYDDHARDLPWRVPPHRSKAGQRPDPYHIWLSEVMLQQTTVAAVRPYFAAFTASWPKVGDLAAARDADVMAAWAGLGYYARARNLLKCARVVDADHDGRFPGTEEGLAALPGIGPYTAAAVAAIAFDQRAVVVDGNVERVMARYHDLRDPLPGVKPEMKARAAGMTPATRPGDYAQAVMDLGATVCTPRNPACGICPLMERCKGRRAGSAPDLPVKAQKVAKPVRYGIAYLAVSPEGEVLLETRPDKGLLGGMLGLPGPAWAEGAPVPAPPLPGDWRDAAEVRHTFTHFHLRLYVQIATGCSGKPPEGCHWVPRSALSPKSLPTVFRKALNAGLAAL